MKKFLVILFLELILSNSSYANCSSGNCTNGQGTYTAADGLKYVGEFKDDDRHGYGITKFASGATFFGEFKNDHAVQGTFTDKNGDSCKGKYLKGKFIGEHICIRKNKIYVMKFKNDKIQSAYELYKKTSSVSSGNNHYSEFKPRLYYDSFSGGMRECSYDPGATGRCLSFKKFNRNSYNKDTLFFNPSNGLMQPCVGAVMANGKCSAYGIFNHSVATRDKGNLYYDPKNKKMTTCSFVSLSGKCSMYDLAPNNWAKNDNGFRMTDSSNPYYKRVPRTSQDLIDVGMRMLTGQCTIGIDC